MKTSLNECGRAAKLGPSALADWLETMARMLEPQYPDTFELRGDIYERMNAMRGLPMLGGRNYPKFTPFDAGQLRNFAREIRTNLPAYLADRLTK